jgi:lipoyl(octanoyl) transferase
MNITREPHSWFNQIVACGLADVKAVSAESTLGKAIELSKEIDPLASTFARLFDREAQKLDLAAEGEVGEAIAELEKDAVAAGDWHREPRF